MFVMDMIRLQVDNLEQKDMRRLDHFELEFQSKFVDRLFHKTQYIHSMNLDNLYLEDMNPHRADNFEQQDNLRLDRF